jgi:putative acetyltransferase
MVGHESRSSDVTDGGRSIVVRRTQPDDAPAFAATLAGSRAVWGTMQVPFPSVSEWRRKLESNRDDVISLVACVGEADGEVVGNLALLPEQLPRRRHVASLAMAVRDDWQGRGVGTTLLVAAVDLADNWLQVIRVELDVYPDNEPAVRLYTAFGFEVEGRARGAAFRDGAYVDVLHMARIHPRLSTELPDP